MTFLDRLRALDASATGAPWHVGNPTPLRPAHTVYSAPFGLGDVAEVGEEPNAALIVALRNSAPAIAALVEAAGDVLAAYDALKAGQSIPSYGAIDRLRDTLSALNKDAT